MAKQSLIEKEKRREKLVDKFWERRQELKKKIKDQELGEEEKEEARMKLNSLPRDSSKVRLRNRCMLTGRPRGYYRKFQLSRNCFRELAHQGFIPGVTKASW